jgi:hypothetical protein
MTIAVAIKTGSAIIFAADSKVSTQGVAGYNEEGDIVWRPQTYDNAYKVARDQNRRIMAMVAGYGDIGRLTATDFIKRYHFPLPVDVDQVKQSVSDLGTAIQTELRTYWGELKVEESKWRAPSLWVASATSDGMASKVFEGVFAAPNYVFEERLEYPGIALDGSYREVRNLLYGVDWQIVRGVLKALNVTDDAFLEALRQSKIARPVDKINFWTMPTQDAIELAVFVAKVQIQMDRFLPEEAACGGPVDVMVLELTPVPSIIEYIKVLHYPKEVV